MVKMLFDDQNNSFFFSGEPASQPQPTSHITNLQDVSLRCVSCIAVTRGCWSGGGLKPNCSSRQDSCVESSQSLAASRVPGGRYSLVLGTRKKWKLKILELSRKLHQRFCLMCRDQKVDQRISKFKKTNKGAKPSAKLRTECLMFLNLSNSNFPLLQLSFLSKELRKIDTTHNWSKLD